MTLKAIDRLRHTLILVVVHLIGVTLVPTSAHDKEDKTNYLDSTERESLVFQVCETIEAVYPFDDIGRTVREGLLSNLQNGHYDEISSPMLLAGRLTADMEALGNDKHLDLYYDPDMAAETREQEQSSEADDEDSTAIKHARWMNFGFRELSILDGQIGYLDLRMFSATRVAGPTAVAAMNFLSHSNAIIIDLRYNGGGSDDMVTLLASYFVDTSEQSTVAVVQSTLDESYYASSLTDYVPGEKLTGIPVYILISSGTASAAEAFASILKHYNRDVVLVGKATAGAEHMVDFLNITGDFVLKIPSYRKIFFGTRSGWEGTGIRPDLPVAADRALSVAHLHAVQSLVERFEGDQFVQDKLQWVADGRQAAVEPRVLSRPTLESYAGQYRGARVLLEEGQIFIRRGDRPKRRLLAVTDEYFVVEGRDDQRVRFMKENERTVAIELTYSDGYRVMIPRE